VKTNKKKIKLILELESCEGCPDHDTIPDYMWPSWERPEKWICKKTEREDNIVARYIEWNDPRPDIPKWCPRRSEHEEVESGKRKKDL
jgi:hypothetical protein